MGLLDRLQKFDAFPKMQEDFRVKTFTGAAVSLVAIGLITLLFVSEVVYLYVARWSQGCKSLGRGCSD